MTLTIKKRDGVTVTNVKQNKALSFLYNSICGRILLKLLCSGFVSKLVGKYMASRLSKCRIKKFISVNNVDMSLYENKEYDSFNDFFIRKKKEEFISIDYDKEALISPCDSKLKVFPITSDSIFFIKGSPYSVSEFLKNDTLANEYKNGLCLVFRLTVDDYHRYCFFDSGKQLGEKVYIKGILHTVNPISLGRYNYYKQNCREYTILETESFGKAVQAEVGAMLVGKIVNYGVKEFSRGDEKGRFEFGGSTIVVLLKEGVAEIDKDIVENSEQDIETAVRIGERIGKALTMVKE